MKNFLRPTVDGSNGSYVTTPFAGTMIQLLGAGTVTGPVALTRDEWARVKRLYGYQPESPTQRPEKPAPLHTGASYEARHKHEEAVRAWERWTDPRPFMQAGADRNAVRHAECDGLRMLAWIARYLQPGEDPVMALVRMAVAAGMDVDPADLEWSDAENAEEVPA